MATVVFTVSNVNNSSAATSRTIAEEILRQYSLLQGPGNQADPTAKLTQPSVVVS